MLDSSIPTLIICPRETDQVQLTLDTLRTHFDWTGTTLEQADVHLYDGRETGLKIEEVRDISQEIQYQPVSGQTYIIVLGIDNASLPAQQALLKMLEEPPVYVRWLLVGTHLASILPTIQSRCAIKDLTHQQTQLNEEAATKAQELFEKITTSSVGDVIGLSDTFSDRNATQATLGQLIQFLHHQPVTASSVRQLKILDHTYQMLTTNVNLKLAVGECFLALRTA